MSTAVLAAIAAIAALLSGGHANKAVMKQIQTADTWNERQGNAVKLAVRETKVELLEALGKAKSDDDADKLAKYKKEKDDLFKEAKSIQSEADEHFEQHEVYARGVTMFQIAITVAAIAVLSKRAVALVRWSCIWPGRTLFFREWDHRRRTHLVARSR